MKNLYLFNVIFISAAATIMVMMLMILFSMTLISDAKSDVKKGFNATLVATLLANACCIFSCLTYLFKAGSSIKEIFALAVFIAFSFMAYFYSTYIGELIGNQEKRSIFLKYSFIGLIASVIIELVSFFSGFLFTYTDNYEIGPLMPLAILYASLVAIVCFIISYKKAGSPITRLLYSLCSLSPIFGLVFRFIFSNFPYVEMLFCDISVFLMYIANFIRNERKLSKSQTAIMVSQIQPHFIYNTLTAIMVLCDENPDEAKNAIGRFSDYLRINIDSMRKFEPIPFKVEMKHIETYLYFEKLRFEDKISISTNIDDSDFKVPALSIQPIVENAIKHGICKKKGGGTVTITSQKVNGGHRIIVSDDGVGFEVGTKPADGRVHIGLENVAYRLQAISGGTLDISSRPDQGTVATIFIPD